MQSKQNDPDISGYRNTTSGSGRASHLRRSWEFAICLMLIGSAGYSANTWAQGTSITPTLPASKGLGTTVAPSGNFFDITGGTRRGTNLFHSFHDFSVGNNRTARFISNTGNPVSNILSRVTGPNVSRINGTIQANGGDFGNTNLYLLNPAGIIFGANANLDISGSFHASTADYLRMGDSRSIFYANPDLTSSLVAAPVTAFGFLDKSGAGQRPGTIVSTSKNLSVNSQRSLSLVGGEIDIVGSVVDAPNGVVNIASLTEQGGEVILAHKSDLTSIVSVQGLGGQASNPGQFARFSMHGGSKLRVDSISSAGEINIWTGDTVINDSTISSKGNGGAINLQANNLSLIDGGVIDKTNKAGTPGRINVRVEDTLGISSNTRKFSQLTNSTASAQTGITTINAEHLVIGRNGVVRATSTGSGDSGDTNINVSELSLSGNGQIQFRTDGSGDGGSLKIRGRDGHSAANRVSISGNPDDPIENINSQTGGAGRAGDIDIKANSMELANSATISARSESRASGAPGNITIQSNEFRADGNSRIVATSVNGTSGGNILIRSGEFVLDNHSEISTSTTGTSTGGNIQVEVTNARISNDSGILSESLGESSGRSGNIRVLAFNDLTLKNRGSISVATQQADAGEIFVDTGHFLTLDEQSSISTSAANGKGDGGDITIGSVLVPELVQLHGKSSIIAQAVEGQGGDIDITTKFLILSVAAESIIDASSSRGIDGTVIIRSPAADPITGQDPLPDTFLDVARLLPERCGAGTGMNSKLVIHDGQGIPSTPDSLLASGFNTDKPAKHYSFTLENRAETTVWKPQLLAQLSEVNYTNSSRCAGERAVIQ